MVTGLPRSGTSLMMQILNAGGKSILTDNIRKPDVNNPKGYFEFEKVKSLQKDNSWINEAEEKAVKVIVQLITYLPPDRKYSVILMERNPDEIILSQNKMIENLGGTKQSISSEVLKNTFVNQYEKAKKYLSDNLCFNVYKVNYNELLSGKPEIIDDLNKKLNLNLDVSKSTSVIDTTLYRNRIEI